MTEAAQPSSAPSSPETPADGETTQAETPQAPPNNQLSVSLRSIMQREQALRDREDQLKQLPQLRSEVEEMRNLARTNPMRFLESVGVSEERFNQARNEVSDPAAGLRRELEELKQTIQLQQSQTRERNVQQELEQVKSSVVRWVDGSEEFPHVRAAGAGALVFQKMQEDFQRTGQETSEAEAAKAIEADLRALRDRLNAVELGDEANQSEPEARGTAAPTLTNSTAARAQAPTGLLTKEQAAAMLRFTDTD